MKELDFLEIIKKTLTKKSHIGDDCAYLKDLGIVITQDSLVEDIHFSTRYYTPYQLGYKSVIVNISDILASGAIPKYLTISLSLPNNVDNFFVQDFYKACEDLSEKFNLEIIGGDITGSEKIFISVCAIGLTNGRKIASRSYANVGDYVITTGVHGSSAAGLWLLQKGFKNYPDLINSHLIPNIKKDFSEEIALNTNIDYAMMDTSDGIVDALFKIALASNVLISVDFDKIPYNKNIETIAEQAGVDFRNWVLYGGEDFQLVACVNESCLQKINSNYTIIGQVKKREENHFVELVFSDNIEKINDLEKTFNHFKGKNEV